MSPIAVPFSDICALPAASDESTTITLPVPFPLAATLYWRLLPAAIVSASNSFRPP